MAMLPPETRQTAKQPGMKRLLAAAIPLFIASLLTPTASWACAFVPPYRLPVPFAIYAWASTITLGVSFAIVAVAGGSPSLQLAVRGMGAVPRGRLDGDRSPLPLGGIISLGLLILSISTGFVGAQDPFLNFNMTLFWMIFVLGVPYTTLLFGDFYPSINPWRTLVSLIAGGERKEPAGIIRYPSWLGYYPALVLYMGFIWLELFSTQKPLYLSVALVGYSIINVVGAWMFGSRNWFRYGEFFGVFLRLIGYAAPFTKLSNEGARTDKWRLRLPFSGLLDNEAEHMSLLVFILFMLSSTAYDGFHQTLPSVTVFWGDIFPRISPLLSDVPRLAYERSLVVYNVWQWFWLFCSPFIYLAVLMSFVALMKVFAKTKSSIRELSLRFSMTLVPIAVVYHITHYYPELVSQAPQMIRLISDPFGVGWNLFGTARLDIPPILIDAGAIWMSQVVLIVLGHIAGVCLAHAEALRVFADNRRATLSQLPMLLLMVLFTTAGLWILSLPLAPAQ